MHQTDLVLINPAARRRVYQSLGQELAAVEPPIWLGMMATFVRRHGYQVAVIDAEAEELSPAEVAERVRELRARLAAVVVYGHQPSASTQTMPAASEVCAALKDQAPDCKRLLCGGHPAALPERTLREEPVDFVAGGEGLYTLVDLIGALGTANPAWAGVRDLWYRDAASILRGPAAPLVQNLDADLPGGAWDLLPMERYRAHNWHCLGETNRQPYAAIYTTLGCPYRCTFCCIQAPFKSGEAVLRSEARLPQSPTSEARLLQRSRASGNAPNSYRMWSPSRVVDQLELLAMRYGVRHVKIADEMFVLNRRHVEAICDLIVERGLELNLWAYARVDTVRDDLLPKLKRAGFNWLAFGIEAADGEVRKGVDKAFDQDDIYRTLERVRAEGIYVIGNYIFGLPDDDLRTMQQTLDLALDLNCEFGNFYSAMAYPGSPLYTTALESGWPLPRSWSGYSQHAVDTLPLPTRHVSAADVLRFRDQAFETYYTSPRYLAMMESKFGLAAVAAIRQMTAHRLEREIYDTPWSTRLACAAS